MAEYGGLPQRIVSTVVVTITAFCWQAYRESGGKLQEVLLQSSAASPWVVKDVIWPPSPKSAPFLGMLILNMVFLVRQTFFNSEETAEIKRVRIEKKRLVLAQMRQALQWNVEETGEEDEEDEGKNGDKPTCEKRPPSAADLFDMVYDDVEERHVTEYGIAADEEPYVSTLALFKERLMKDFEEYTKLTRLARCDENDEGILTLGTSSGNNEQLDSDQLKRIPEFRDGTKLADLIELYKKQIKRAFGKHILDKKLLCAAEECRRDLAREQRQGAAMLWPALQSVLPMYSFAICLMIFDASNGTVVFHSMKTLLDSVGSGKVTIPELRAVTLQTYIKFIFCVFAHLTSWAFTHKVTAEFRLRIRNEIMSNMVRQDMKFFDFYSSGILQERLNNDAEQLSSKMFHLPIRLTDCFFRLISCVLMLYTLEPQLFYVVAIPVPVIAVSCHFIIRYMKTLKNRQRKIGEHVAEHTSEVLKEIRTVREFGMEMEESDKFAAQSAYRAEIEQYASGMHHIVLIAPLCCLFEGMRFLCTYLAGGFVASGQLTPGQAVMAAGLAGDMTHIMRDVFEIMPEIVSVLQPLGRVCDMLSATPKIEPHPGSEPKLKPAKFMGYIEFKDVNFTFPTEPLKQVLYNLTWSIAPGEKVGFVGGTGCGKSTSFYLLERWYNPTSGSIMLDGRDIREYDVHHLRQHMSVVAQTTCLFSTTIRENIVYGLRREVRESISDVDIEKALTQANAWTFVNEFPRKLETYAGERGVKLSGGQKQRLAIARAIIRKPTLILLDEATSALDSKAEVVVQTALDEMISSNVHGCTLIVAHRLSTLRTCDRITVMDKGSIKESGSHAELMAIDVTKDANGNMKTGWYRDLYETQHGRSETAGNTDKLEAEVRALKDQIVKLKEDNSHLKGDMVRSFRLGKARRTLETFPPLPLPTLFLKRATSEDVVRTVNGHAPPAPLELDRAKTTFNW